MTLDQKKKKTLDLCLLNKFKIEKKNNNNWTRLLCGSEVPLNFIFNKEKNLRTIR